MVFDGKTYRNLQDQVAYLTSMYKALGDRIEEVAAQIPSKMIVEELPETGDPLVTYYVGPKGTEPNQYYEVWVWVQEEPEGPFVWRELEDTDSVDLSGYLEKQTAASTYNQIYAKTSAGEQTMLNVYSAGTDASTVAMRDSYGRLNCANPGTGVGDGINAVNKQYADANYLALQSGTTDHVQVYTKNADGTQGMVNIGSNYYDGNALVIRDANGDIRCNTGNNYYSALNSGTAEGRYVKRAGNTSYSYNRVYGISRNQTDTTTFRSEANATAYAIVERNSSANIILPDQVLNPPTNDNYAVSKGYIAQVVGQLVYKHAIVLDFTYNSTLLFSVKINLVNGKSTPYTNLGGKQLLSYLESGCYSITTNSFANNEFWSVAVCPSANYIHGDTGFGLLLTSAETNATVYVDGIETDYNADISSVTISDVVTTW